MRRTTKPTSASDPIKPIVKSHSQTHRPPSKNKNKTNGPSASVESDSELVGKSNKVKRLESLLKALRSTSGVEKDPKGGCFCLARTHDLSPYTPICHSCSLILCSLNQPYHSCPDCLKPLLHNSSTSSTSPTLETIIAQVELNISDTISRETQDRQRALDEARKAAGAFPALPSAATQSDHQHQHQQHHQHHQSQHRSYPIPTTQQTHKVMSLTTNKGKKKNHNGRQTVTITTRQQQPSRSGSVTPNVNMDEEPTRVGPPKIPPVSIQRPDPNRPFQNFLHGSVTYKPSSPA